MSSNGANEGKPQLMQSCRAYAGSLTKKYKELEVLMLDPENLDKVTGKADQLDGVFIKYTERFGEYHKMLTGEEADKVLEDFDAKRTNKEEFDERLSVWMKEAKEHCRMIAEPTKEDDDCMSLRSSGSNQSVRTTSSTTSSRLREARIKAEVAKLKLEQIKETQRLKMEQLKLEQQIANVEAVHGVQEAEIECKLLLEDEEGGNYVAGEVSASKIRLNPDVPPWTGSIRNDVMMHVPPKSNLEVKDIFSVVDLAMNMPKPELDSFSGNPLEYWSFINKFEAVIGNKNVDDRSKLMYLIQYCSGKAKESIENCLLLDAGTGYNKAKEILSEQFGQSFLVTTAHINKVLNRQPIRPNDGAALWDMARDMRRCEIVLSQMGYSADMNSSDNLLKIQQLMPIHMQSEWAKRAHNMMRNRIAPNFSMMVEFVEQGAQLSSNMFGRNIGKAKPASPKTTGKSNAPKRVFSTQAVGSTQAAEQTSKKPGLKTCPCCSGSHHLGACKTFQQKTRDERLKVVRQARICDNCFEQSHIARNCSKKSNCEVSGCKWKHHTLLHLHQSKNESSEGQVQKGSTSTTAATSVTGAGKAKADANDEDIPAGNCNSTMTTNHRVCLRVVPVIIQGQHKEIQTLALLDQASDVSLCDESLVHELGITGKRRDFHLTTVNEKNTKKSGLEVNLSVKGLNCTEQIDMPKVWTVSKLPISGELIPDQRDIQKWNHLKGIEFPRIQERDIKLLIGGDIPEAFWVLEQRRGNKKEPFAILSPLGWTLMGPTRQGHNHSDEFNVNFTQVESVDLHQQLSRFWQLDHQVGKGTEERLGLSVEDKRAKAIMEGSIQLVDNHYELGLPWRHDRPYLPDNLPSAQARLKYLKKRFFKDDALFEKYKSTVQGYIEKGYAEEVNHEEVPNEEESWYLPHHPVVHPRKPEKVRVVYDCAAKYKGTSLNDQLLRGPDLTNSIVGVLTRFRQERVAVVGDIEAMFHQVKVPEKDRHALRFLWWKDGDLTAHPTSYQMTVHLFGATSSPSCAAFALRKTAEDNEKDFSKEAVNTVRENFYVDDCLKSVPTKDDAVKIVQELCDLLKKGGFRLTKWVSNDRDALSSIPEAERAPSVIDLDLDGLPIERTLGVLWDVSNDHFGFKVSIKEKPPSRRGILSMISSLYDPLGFVAPFVLPAKMLLQSICRRGADWDQLVEGEDLQKWRKWLDDLPHLSDIAIQRCLKPVTFGEVASRQLHHFCDASERGYSAVSYLRQVSEGGKVHCSFIMGKSRLCPLKATSIPRLELTAAVLAVSLDQQIQDELRLPVTSTTFWTDSTSVLQYIMNESRRFQTFVANRVAKIHEATDKSQWRHVDTKLNPADEGSRGLSGRDMASDPRWLNGPDFLWEEESSWPTQPSVLQNVSDDDPEIKKTAQVNLSSVEKDVGINNMLQRYSSWNKLKRGVAWLLRYKGYLRAKTTGQVAGDSKKNMSLNELQCAELEILRLVQEQELHDKDQRIINKLNPVLKDGILRVGGRISNAPIDFEAKHPIILPSSHHVTTLLILHYHLIVGHSGAGLTWSSLREKYWIIKGGATVRKVIGKCFDCRKRNAPRLQQMMSELPAERVTPEKPPFTYVGVDYFGPLYVKQGRSQVKRYGCIFTCLTIRAVHIEIARSLDTDAFINALRRFISRRGTPEKIFSDNGTNFRGAEKELRENLEKVNQREVENILHQKGIEWSFNPPTASHMGGVWERMIRSTRKILKGLLNEQVVSDEVLSTAMAEVEAILNARPLTQLSMDAHDQEPLTPNHLLLMKRSPNLPPGLFGKEDSYGRRRWRQSQYLASVFWKRWCREYLPLLQERQKWTKPHRNLEKDDLVLVVDETLPRGQWSLGRVVDVFPGRDGRVRQVEVRVGHKYFRRPVVKLCLLEANTSA
ncbi:uncharacterized protein LOC129257739 [Lytechinus pictus]|uniref:uncharacterized protein LOC129257739 n=1 Tax=Lytechinus pictus TaxID=7653 RepID=UPI0030BA21F0